MSRTKKIPESLEQIVKPSVQVAGDRHILDEMIESGSAPEMKAIGYMKLGAGRNNWVSYTVTFKGREVLAIDVDEPNMRAVAEEAAKIAFVNEFTDKESA